MKIAIVGAGKLGLRVIESMITGGNSITSFLVGFGVAHSFCL